MREKRMMLRMTDGDEDEGDNEEAEHDGYDGD